MTKSAQFTGVVGDNRWYLLLTTIPVYFHAGKYHTEELWVKDLGLHIKYIQRLKIACPVKNAAPPANYRHLPEDVASKIAFVQLPAFDAKSWQIIKLPLFLLHFVRHIRTAEILHCTVGNHPILYGLVFPVLRRFTKMGTIAIVESSSWRKKLLPFTPGIIPLLAERMAKSCVSSASAAFLTQGEYKESLAPGHKNAHVAPAVWVDESNILDEEQVLSNNAARGKNLSCLRVGFFARIEWDKGLDTIISAVRICKENGVRVQVQAYGEGSYKAECIKQASDLADQVQFRGMVRYGIPLFEKIRENHYTVVSNKLDEQSRITYDSYAQGVPVIGSSAWGVRTCVQEGVTGFLFEKANAQELAKVLMSLSKERDQYNKICLQALAECRMRSHTRMHANRAEVLVNTFSDFSSIRKFEA